MVRTSRIAIIIGLYSGVQLGYGRRAYVLHVLRNHETINIVCHLGSICKSKALALIVRVSDELMPHVVEIQCLLQIPSVILCVAARGVQVVC